VRKGNVINLVRPTVSTTTLRFSGGLHVEIEQGEVVGLVVLKMYRGMEFDGHVVGEAKHYPTYTSGMLLKLAVQLASLETPPK
jgi:hypothetical protein